MTGHFPDNVMTALKDTAVKVFWTKKHLREVLSHCSVPSSLIAAQDWDQVKYYVLDPILNFLNQSPEGLSSLRQILSEALSYTDCGHLLRHQDGQRLKREAETALDRLRLLVEKHDATLRTERDELARRRAEVQQARGQQAFSQRLEAIKQRFLLFHSATDKQARGYDLQQILYDLFALVDLEPRGAFRVQGEEIDGAFVLDGDDYLLEAKWQQVPVALHELRDLDGAVASNLDNTLGLFVAINGFSPDALQRYREGGRPRLICMDGTDLMVVLEGQIDLGDLLRRKRSIAAQHGAVFVAARDILQGKGP